MLQEKSKKNDDIFPKKSKKMILMIIFGHKSLSFKQKLVLLQAI